MAICELNEGCMLIKSINNGQQIKIKTIIFHKSSSFWLFLYNFSYYYSYLNQNKN